ncbi:cobalt-precorrin-5B (C(1))-methyltransferase [Roseococcus sp. YIM B11640]|uniref:cobalt-precorrin-5B (C(1))-methyltransferase n=1 Tax=Roseococcus sp. YIM B11640 TaxID=3133973 RepID=UPI003C7BC80D
MDPSDRPGPDLRRGWTTGACATAAAKAAMTALATGHFPDPVSITLPGGEKPAFALARHALDEAGAMAAVVKDAGDDPDVTHGALIRVELRRLPAGSGVVFRAGEGVGTVTRPGLPIPPGEPAINPVPRRMIAAALAEVEPRPDIEVTIAIAGGERLAERTLNARLGILGGLSVLGTTGIVVPYSCAAWIASIHRGIDVARATGIQHIAGSTGSTSETAVRQLHGLPDVALIEMGDFVGGMLKYLRGHPVQRVTIAGGVAKMTKLAQGLLDLHSKRGSADMTALAELAGMPELAACNTVAEAFQRGPAGLGDIIAERARETAMTVLKGVAIDVAIFDREGRLVGHAPRYLRR